MIAVLEELKALGVDVLLFADKLVIRPASKVPPELKERLRAHKAEVLAALARCAHCKSTRECDCPACNLRRVSGPVPCSMCRWVERQAWLAATRPEKCWHCGGKGKCGCIACDSKEPCRTCGGSGKAGMWIQ